MAELNTTETVATAIPQVINETLSNVIGKEIVIDVPVAPVTDTSGALIAVAIILVSAIVAAFLLYGGIKAWRETVLPTRRRDMTKLAKHIDEKYSNRVVNEKLVGRVAGSWCG